MCASLGGVAKQEHLQSHSVQRRVGERGHDVPEETAHGDWTAKRASPRDKH